MEANNGNLPVSRNKRNKRRRSQNWTNAVLKPNAGENRNNIAKANKAKDEERENKTTTAQHGPNSTQKHAKFPASDKIVAMDCEMVGVGFQGHGDMLARVSIVNRNGEVLLDKYVKPRRDITDYRTAISGIRPSNLVNAEAFDVVKREVQQILRNGILVGHSVGKDLKVLHMKHPSMKIRDTATYKPLCNLVSNGRTPSLKRLSEAILGISIQAGEHNSVEDARAAMSIYNHSASDWEQYIENRSNTTRKW